MSSGEKEGHLAVRVGLASNLLLAALKTVAGIVGHSPALLADGINATSDVAYYVVVMVFMRLAHKPPDPEHPYGHRQLESIAAVVVGAFVITTAVAIFWNAVNEVYDYWLGASALEPAAAWALPVALFTIALKFGLMRWTGQVGERSGSTALIALAHDHRNDIFSATAAAVGIFLGQRGYPWVDPLAGGLVALVILRTGIEILHDSTHELMDTVPGRPLARKIHGLLCDIPGVEQVEEIHAHRFGPYLVVNITIGVDGNLTVAEGDAVASQVERALYDNIEFMRRVHVHYHPAVAYPEENGRQPSIVCQ